MSHSECMNAGDSTETGGRWTLKETTKNKTIYRGYIKISKDGHSFKSPLCKIYLIWQLSMMLSVISLNWECSPSITIRYYNSN